MPDHVFLTWQSLKTVRSIDLVEACVSSTPVSITLHKNMNLVAILRNSSESPKKHVKGKPENADIKTGSLRSIPQPQALQKSCRRP